MREFLFDVTVLEDQYMVTAYESIPGLAVFKIAESELKCEHIDYDAGWRIAHIESGMLAVDQKYAFDSRESACAFCQKISGFADYTANIKILNSDLALIQNLGKIEILEGIAS